MKEATQTAILKIDFASPETTIQSFCDVDDNLTAQLTSKTKELCDLQIALDRTRGNAEIELRNSAANSGNKITEGYVTAAMSKNEDINGQRSKVENLEADIAGVKAAIASLERKHSLFKYWLASQRPIGLNER